MFTAHRLFHHLPHAFIVHCIIPNIMSIPPKKPNGNATATWDKDLGMELLTAKRPKGVDDWVEGIPQVICLHLFIYVHCMHAYRNAERQNALHAFAVFSFFMLPDAEGR